MIFRLRRAHSQLRHRRPPTACLTMTVRVCRITLVLALLIGRCPGIDAQRISNEERERKRAKKPIDIVFKGDDGLVRAGHRCMADDPTPEQRRELDEHVRRSLKEGMPERKLATVNIPVIFHVVYKQTSTGAQTGNIPTSMITAQINVLNAAYNPHGFSFTLNRIVRRRQNTFYNYCGTLTYEENMMNSYAIDTARYLNVYTCKPSDGILGWAYFPGDNPQGSKIDGIVVLGQTFPGGNASPYNKGDTLTHEVGHFLGLYHTFQGGCAGGDGVSDTPAENSPAFDCNVNRNTCSSAGNDPVRNFMDYTDDNCMTHFTAGQKDRMHALTSSLRSTMYRAGGG